MGELGDRCNSLQVIITTHRQINTTKQSQSTRFNTTFICAAGAAAYKRKHIHANARHPTTELIKTRKDYFVVYELKHVSCSISERSLNVLTVLEL